MDIRKEYSAQRLLLGSANRFFRKAKKISEKTTARLSLEVGSCVLFEHNGITFLGVYSGGNQITAGMNIYSSDHIVPVDMDNFDRIGMPWNEMEN